MIEINEKELLAIKAVNYGCMKNTRVRVGGTFVENISDPKNRKEITFDDAILTVMELIKRIEGEKNND